jgi:hypothetical protein
MDDVYLEPAKNLTVGEIFSDLSPLLGFVIDTFSAGAYI